MSSSSRRRPVQLICMVVIGLLYLFSVPWYRDADQPLRLWFGLPDWVAVALLCYVGVAIVNAIAWSMIDVSDDLQDDMEDAGEGGDGARTRGDLGSAAISGEAGSGVGSQ